MNLVYVSLLFLMFIAECCSEKYDNNSRVIELNDLPKSTVLSRRKRFLIFPDGSSLQLVFCTQNHGYIQVGDVVWFGNTAALAWELPTDPSLFNMFKETSKFYNGNRRSDNKHIIYVDENGRVISKVPYRRRPIVNPAFAKRSIESIPNKTTISIKKMHNLNKDENWMKDLQKNSLKMHRQERKELYTKIERIMQTLGWNGRECVLRLLCETRNERKTQGTFLEEILRATFTLPKDKVGFEADYHKEYDVAHGSEGDCATLYPGCEDKSGDRLL